MQNFTENRKIMHHPSEFTIIVPIYNEEENIERLTDVLDNFLNNTHISCEILMVDDGSNDKSLEKIKEVCQKNKDFHYISFAKNKGLSLAIKAGFDHTKTPFVGYIDADLQTTPFDFEKLFPFRKEYGLVMGIRTDRKDSFIKNISSKIANGYRNMILKDGVKDTGCPLKIFRTELAQKLPFFNGNHRFYATLIQMYGEKVKQVPVQHFERQAGKAKFGLHNRLFRPFMDCFHVRWLQNRHRNYTLKE